MSAAAAQAGAPRKGAAIGLPPWAASGTIPWTPMPNSWFERAFRALSALEAGVLGLVLRTTVGDVKGGRPEWAEITESRFATLLDCHVNGVSKAIEKLEQLGAIQSEKVGRRKRYRAAVEQWDKLPLRGPRKLERSNDVVEAGDDEEVQEAAISAQVVEMPSRSLRSGTTSNATLVVLLPGDDQPRNLEDVCPHAAAILAAHINEHGPECGLACGHASTTRPAAAKPAHSTQPAHENTGVKAGKPTLECGNGPIPDQVGYDDFHRIVDSSLRKQLAETAPRAITEAAWRRMVEHQIPTELFIARLNIRKDKIRGYGMVPLLVDDCIRAYDAAEATHRAADQATDVNWSDRIREHVQRLVGDLRRRRGLDQVVEMLSAMAKQAGRYAESIVDAELHLSNIEAVLRSQMEHIQSAADKSAIDDEVERRMSGMRSRLTKQAYDEQRAVAYEVVFREHHKLPRLALAGGAL